MRNYTVTAYKVVSELTMVIRADSRLNAEREAKAYFEKRRKGWKPPKIERLYRIEEEEE